MCRFCERSCWRDGGERECELSDAEFKEAMNGPDDYDEAAEVGLDGDELFCDVCGAPDGDCTCPASDPVDDEEANTRGDITLRRADGGSDG